MIPFRRATPNIERLGRESKTHAMPKRKIHDTAGLRCGGTAAYWRAQDQEPIHTAIETFGGALGGRFGSRLPDVIDPPTHPGHRSIGHGIVPIGSAVQISLWSLDELQNELRQLADRHAESARSSQSFFVELLHMIVSLVYRAGAGAAAGAVAGYVSHLALDATTPKGLPLVK